MEQSKILSYCKISFYISLLILCLFALAWVTVSAIYLSNAELYFLEIMAKNLSEATKIILVIIIVNLFIALFLMRINTKYSIGRFFAKITKELVTLMSITLALSLVATGYPLLKNNFIQEEESYADFLSNSIREADDYAYRLIEEGKFKDLSFQFIENNYISDKIHFKIKPNAELAHNIELSQKGDYEKIYLSSESDNDRWLLPNFEEFEDGSIGWVYSDKEIFKKSTSINFSVNISNRIPSCFSFDAIGINYKKEEESIRRLALSVPSWSPFIGYEGETICLEHVENLPEGEDPYKKHLVVSTRGIVAPPEDFDVLIFKIKDLDENSESQISGEKPVIRTDVSGNGHAMHRLSFCMEGYHESNPEEIISYNQGEIKNGKC